MAAPLLAILPVVALIGVGYALRRGGFPGEGFWRPAARLVYFVFLPALLVRLVALARLDPTLWRAQAAAALAVATIAAALWVLRKRTSPNGPGFTSVLQGSIRHNTYVGLAVAAAVFTPDETAAFALVVAAIVPLVNAIAVAGLSRYGAAGGDGTRPRPRMARAIVTNPLIIACVLGGVLNVSGAGLPAGLGEVLRMLGQPALPVGLLVVGAGLRPAALLRPRRGVLIPTAVKLLVYPALALAYASVLAVVPEHRGPLLLFACLPTAASAYVLALELGGDEELMAQVITAETIAAAVTIPVGLALGGVG